MRYNVISYLIGEGFGNVLKNKKSTVISITTMCLTMLLFGTFFILGENINHIVKSIEQQQGMQVYIDKTATSEEVSIVEQDKIKNKEVRKQKEEEIESLTKEIEELNSIVEEFAKRNNRRR